MLLLSVYIFILGLVLGSFYNVVGFRMAKGESIVHPPSHCLACGRRLHFLDLIPVLSYLFLRGRCRGCGNKISWIYPIIELCCGLLFLAVFLHSTSFTGVLTGWLLISLLLIIFVSDLSEMMIPDKVLIVFLILFAGLRILVPMHPWWDPAAGFAAGFLMLLAIAYLSKGGMGGGDIKLFAVLGVILGLQGVITSFLLSALYGALFGSIGLLSGYIKRGQPVPFGPFIVLGTLTAYFFGQTMINMYISLLS